VVRTFVTQSRIASLIASFSVLLARARFRDDSMFAHAYREKRLPQRVVDLVRAGMREVFALEINLRPAEMLTEPLRVGNRRRATRICSLQIGELCSKGGIIQRRIKRLDQFVQRRDQSLRHKPPAIFTIVAARIRHIYPVGADKSVSVHKNCPLL
jgi:hypothetical protein